MKVLDLLLHAPWWAMVSLIGLILLLVWLIVFTARQHAFFAGQRAADRRNCQQQQYDYDRGRVDGVRETITHLRATGQLVEFRHPPAQG